MASTNLWGNKRRKLSFQHNVTPKEHKHIVSPSGTRGHFKVSQTINGYIRVAGENAWCGAAFRMDKLFSNDVSYATQWDDNMFNDGVSVSHVWSYNEFDGLASTALIGSRQIGERFQNAWVSSAEYDLAFQRAMNPTTLGSIFNVPSNADIYTSSNSLYGCMCPLASTQAVGMQTTGGQTTVANCIFPGNNAREIFANTVRQPECIVAREPRLDTGNGTAKLNYKVAVEKYSPAGYPLASAIFWNNIISSDTKNPPNPAPAYMWVGFYDDNIMWNRNNPTGGAELSKINPDTFIRFTMKIKLHITAIGPRLQTRLYNTVQSIGGLIGSTGPTGIGNLDSSDLGPTGVVEWPYSNTDEQVPIPNPE